MGPRYPTEADEAIALTKWLRSRNILFLHIPNEGMRSFQSAQRLKAQGLQQGAPDYLIFTPARHLPNARGVALELKRQGYSPSDVKPRQLHWLYALDAIGWVTIIAGGAAEAIAELQKLGY